jgi:thioredoxin-like negative regulator of GroEL
MIHLKSSNFTVRGDKLVLTHMAAPTLVTFTANNCPGCDMLLKEMQVLVKNTIGMYFAVMNITEGDGRLVVEKSNHTKKPITVVPTVFFYVNHVPVSKFTGDYTREHLEAFMSQMFSEIGKQPFQYEQRSKQPPPPQDTYTDMDDGQPPSRLLDYNTVDPNGGYDRLDSAYE